MERRARFSFGYYLFVLAGMFALQSLLFSGFRTREVAYSQFRDWITEGRVEDVVITSDKIVGELKEPEAKGTPDDGEVSPPSKHTPWHLGALWDWVTRERGELDRARAHAEAEQQRHFTVTPLEDPGLVDLLQAHGVEYRAIAGEAGVPFFSLSGSDFVEMFVGVGAARVRDLFTEAKQKAPCIIFIDELDAIGKSRGQAGAAMGGYDERENTLNQLLVELDGFDGRAAVILMAATNRPEVLDPALLRPGRFDRQVLVDRPHRDGRRAILEVHARKLVLGEDVDLAGVAAQTPGFVGADLANICNEAALLASRKGHMTVQMEDFQDAIERVIGGLEKKGGFINESERRTVAVHESGHTLIGHFTEGADPVQKVSIVPRGRAALGYTLQTPLEDRFLLSREELLGRVRVLLGGRAAEELIFGEISTGASDDLEKASGIVRQMLTVYGMSETLPNLSLVQRQSGFLGQTQETAPAGAFGHALAEEQMKILASQYGAAKELLAKHRERLEALAERLLSQEKLEPRDLAEILGPRAGTDEQA